MSERYTRLFTLPENLYIEGSPVVISAGALLKDNQTGRVLVQLKIKSISDKIIKAVRVSITQFDVVGIAIDTEVNQEMLDLAIERNSEFGQKTAIMLPNPSTRSFSVAVTEVIFSDNDIWMSDGAEWKSVIKPQTVYEYFKNDNELIKQYKLDYNVTYKNMFAEDKDLWICSCGNINKKTDSECYRCGCLYETFKSFDMVALEKSKNERVEEETRIAREKEEEARIKAEKDREEAEKRSKRNKKIAGIIVSVVFVLIALCVMYSIVWNTFVLTNNQYKEAVALMEVDRYREAISAFSALGEYRDSDSKKTECIKKELKDAKVGDYINIGCYEQDNDMSNSKEDIEWIVLEIKEGKALVVSRYALDFESYNTSSAKVTWETCTLRKWLNSDFFDTAFSDLEKAMIPTATVTADKNSNDDTAPSNSTQDKIFLLSISETKKYFDSDKERWCKPTDYANAKGNNVLNWWLRSPSPDQYNAANVLPPGNDSWYGYSASYSSCLVRPAMWIDFGS